MSVKREARIESTQTNECDVGDEDDDDLTIITHLITRTVNNGKRILSNCNELYLRPAIRSQ